MKKFDKQTIINHIDEFEKHQKFLSPRDAEVSMLKILKPLLETEGYSIIDNTNKNFDKGVDILGIKDNERVGVEYKHYRNGAVGRRQLEGLINKANLAAIDRIIFLSNKDFTDDVRDFVDAFNPIAIELLDVTGLKRWVSRIEANYQESEIVQVLKAYVSKLIELIAKSSKTLAEIEWRDIERVVAEVFAGLGFDAKLTQSSKDGGKDVILECLAMGRQKSFIVEIKHWRSGQKVREGKIREFIQVITKEKRDGGLFLSTYGFVENAIESLTQIDREKVKFGSEKKIATLCTTYIRKKSGLWENEDQLPTILFEDTI